MSGHLTAADFSPVEAMRQRCRELHLPTWRCDTGGTIVEEPTEPGLKGLWLRTPQVLEMVSRAATRWAREASGGRGSPEVIVEGGEAAPGCWLIPLPESRRPRAGGRTGMIIAMALGPHVIGGPMFARACKSSGLDEQATRAVFRDMATYDAASAKHAAIMLRWMAQDVASLGEYQDAVRGFTTELTQSYETIDLLYALGRSMLDLNHPEKFVNLACERLHETMPFGWMAARFCSDKRTAGSLASQLLVRGEAPVGRDELAAALDRLTTEAPKDMRSFIVSADTTFGGPSEARLLIQPISRDGELAGIMICGNKGGDDPQVSSYDMQLLEAAAAFTGAFLENARLYREQQALFMGSLKSLTAAIDAKDRYTCGHSERVALLAAQMARLIGMSDADAERIHICGLVHDVGKIGVPESVLCKPGRLTEEEFALIRLHPEIGHRIIQDIPMFDDILGGVLHHHERWDGKGYPHGLAGEAIPLFARIIGLVDAFDAMSSTRSYRPAVARQKVLEEIANNRGTQFDPSLTTVFLELDLRPYDALVERHSREHNQSRGLSKAA